MSGTSMDGIDAVLCKHHAKGDETLAHLSLRYPRRLELDLRARIFHYEEKLHHPLDKLSRLHWDVGHSFARAATRLLDHARKRRLLRREEKNIVIGSHGQTIFHAAQLGRTWQIGEASCLSEATGLTCVSDFRAADVASGGQGAPLLPWYHRRIAGPHAREGVVVHNLGGISNFTYIGRDQLIALDTGPANCMLDTAIQLLTNGRERLDRGGKSAQKGFVHLSALEWLLHRSDVKKFRRLPAPKSTGRELFSHGLTLKFLERAEKLHMSRADILATLVAFATHLMSESYERFVFQPRLPLKRIFLAGGGTRNLALVDTLSAALPEGIRIERLEQLGVDSQVLEAQAFGFFAWCCLAAQPITSLQTTGTRQPQVLGKISPGKNFLHVTRLVAGKTQFLA